MQAFVFPGQGSQFCGMGRDFFDGYPEARLVFEEAGDRLGISMSRLCFEGPQEELVLTENTQPALLTVSVAIWRVLGKRGRIPDFVAGHSLGEYSAVVAAGGLDFGDAVEVVRLRGRFMQESVPPGEGSMAAILGLDAASVGAICEEASEGEVVSAANLNAPDQIVIAGHVGAVSRASELATGRGAMRVIPLSVSAPFHCRLMEPARRRLEEVLSNARFQDLEIPLVNNVDGEVVRSGDEVRSGLVRQVVAPVRWTDCVVRLKRQGVDSVVEVGPGKVLSGLVRRTDRSLQVSSIGTVEQWQSYEASS